MPTVEGAGGEDNSSSAIAEHMRLRRPRNQISYSTSRDLNLHPHIPSITQSTRCKSTISSLLLSTFSHNHSSDSSNTQTRNSASPQTTNTTNNDSKKKNFKNSALRGFGCTAHPEVTVPAVIRSSADWEGNREKTKKKDDIASGNDKSKTEERKKKKKKKKGRKQQQQQQQSLLEGSGVQELWCGPGIVGGFTTDAASVDCVVSTTRPLSGRGKIDIDKVHHREHHPYSSRQRTNPDQFADLYFDSAFEYPRIGADVFEARYYHHLRNRSPEGLAEIMMFRNGLLLGRRSDGFDRYGDWRLDVDNMSYEELLELGDRIGYVNTGLGEDQIGRCIRKTKAAFLDDLSSHLPVEMDGKCSICQEEYEAEDEMGKLDCGHAYHMHCIQQWLVQKNACPVCKAEASSK